MIEFNTPWNQTSLKATELWKVDRSTAVSVPKERGRGGTELMEKRTARGRVDTCPRNSKAHNSTLNNKLIKVWSDVHIQKINFTNDTHKNLRDTEKFNLKAVFKRSRIPGISWNITVRCWIFTEAIAEAKIQAAWTKLPSKIIKVTLILKISSDIKSTSNNYSFAKKKFSVGNTR